MRAPVVILLAAASMLGASSAASAEPNVVGSAYYSGGPHRMQSHPEAVPGVALVAMKGTAVVLKTRTGPRGSFALRLGPGIYLLKLAIGSPLHVCGAARVDVRAHQVRQLKLYCNIR
jgi:hypothetical protein